MGAGGTTGQVGRARSKCGEFPAMPHKCTLSRSGVFVSRAPPARAGALRGGAPRAALELSTRARHGAELELSDARTTGPGWSCPRGRHGAELELSTRAHLAELELSDAGASGRAGAVHARTTGPELELSDTRATGPSWICRSR